MKVEELSLGKRGRIIAACIKFLSCDMHGDAGNEIHLTRKFLFFVTWLFLVLYNQQEAFFIYFSVTLNGFLVMPCFRSTLFARYFLLSFGICFLIHLMEFSDAVSCSYPFVAAGYASIVFLLTFF